MLVMGMSMVLLGFTMYAKHVAWDFPGMDTVSVLGNKTRPTRGLAI
jgi:hypothetical protein